MTSGTLYVIGLPIGNLKDISHHAQEVLQKLNILACEDTRHAFQLLKDLNLPHNKKLISLYKDNEQRRVPILLKLLKEGNDIGLIVSRGMPLISDPGYVCIREIIQQNIPLHILPGPSACTAALAISGLPPDKFVFLGFPPRKPGKQKNFFEKYAKLEITLIFYESPRRIDKTLHNLEPLFGTWNIAICRELTKIHEEVIRGNYSETLNSLKEKKWLGEMTILISPKI
ncbi:MAG: 16S rRNA (cytidine(1402)-2'-O)-methyltransferase [Deltaproteobacteria bacterium GWA2_38_16]|nr:MAG: 16S rRNA (cytidine(1402)-2'-O)-methyltransferase [Deltaproteobacteria bacterium GWA2_38_16]OGQ03114.1 MAG: 16S rRNA (cytidine(1402)-2'-O)-methyltransferase [Deltaproteobacteria bacterium RIFCSPHIGHO2_02_FULL_38_15]OGQ33829.1 MAG: 16S rRNA (cytidine(1402)-2'-O)-methyltransferase [Deltaproteobacteria bacterium RIFCSPLOWO2_01_FULL_38_9]HBQ20466.1 16S rRNA (cytidine(1402)-2'-O)-methyltransferase [Deltaproteobacteria bacterium]